jgi:hypothetical protein
MRQIHFLLFILTGSNLSAQNTPVKVWENNALPGYFSQFRGMPESATEQYWYTAVEDSDIGNPLANSRIAKYDISSGLLLWRQELPEKILVSNLKTDKNDNVYFGGYDNVNNLSERSRLFKYNTAGIKQWELNLYPNFLSSVYEILPDASDNILLTTSVDWFRASFASSLRYMRPDGRNIWEVRFQDNILKTRIIGNRIRMLRWNGSVLSIEDYDFNGNRTSESVVKLSRILGPSSLTHLSVSGEIILANVNGPYVVEKLDSKGRSLWRNALDTTTVGYNSAMWSLKEDDKDDYAIYVTGTFIHTIREQTCVTVKFSKDGKLLWQIVNNPRKDSLTEVGLDIAVDSRYVYVGGYSDYKGANKRAINGFVSIHDKQTGQRVYYLQIDPRKRTVVGKVIPMPDGFLLGGADSLRLLIARYRLPTVSTTEPKTANNITLYPNPTTRHLTIENIDKEQFNTAELWDSGGRLLLSSPVTDTTLHWQPEALPPGTYQVVLQGPGGRLAKQIVVMHQ